MPLSTEQFKFARDWHKLMQHAWNLGFEISMRELQRPKELQPIYVEKGLSWTMDSSHIESRAIDCYFFRRNGMKYELVKSADELRPLGEYWRMLDVKNEWGGFWKKQDAPHFERRKTPRKET